MTARADRDHERRAERAIAVAFALSALAAVGLTITYAAGGHAQVEGALLALSLGGLGWGLAAWGRNLLPQGPFEQAREPLESEEDDREALETTFEASAAPIERRRFLLRLLVGAGGALGVAALFPIRSLGPSVGRDLHRTPWREGARLVTGEGRFVKAGELAVGGVVTVFPEGHAGSADAQTLLLRPVATDLRTRPGREDWAPAGHVAYSKICTHAGCPVGLYQVEKQQLLCPCHQSLFDVLDGARPVFGPATRSLPQLALRIDGQGFLRARGDYAEPVGPAFWERR